MSKKTLLLFAVILLFGIFGMIFLFGSSNILILIAILVLLVGSFAWIMPLILKQVKAGVWFIIGSIILLGLLIPTSSLMSRDYEYGPFSTVGSSIIFLLPSLALVNAAFLLYSGLTDSANNRLKNISFGLCALLIVKTLYNVYDLTLWDNTYDSLGYLWLILPVFAILLSGLTLFIALPYRIKPAGIFYVLIVPVLLAAVSAFAQSVDFHQETEKRAARTVRAIETYYTRVGSYPEALSQLSPWYALSLPKPMIIYGQDWCYEAGDDYYRLVYIDREHWSDPRMIGHIYRSVGEVPDTQPMCMAEFNALQDHFPDYQYSYWKESE